MDRHPNSTQLGTRSLVIPVAIRTDRYEALQTAPELAGIRSIIFDELKPMKVYEFKQLIEGPAKRSTDGGRRLVVDERLVSRLLAESSEQAVDALPMLALALARLYADYGADGDLTLEEYEAMGGMSRVVTSEIERVLASDPTARQSQLELLHAAFIHSVVSDD